MVDYEKILEENEEKNTVSFPSDFCFLSDHNGLRRGELHVLLGPKGGGKSSLMRTILYDTLLLKKRAYLHLSEEPISKYMPPILNLMSTKLDGNKDELNLWLSLLSADSELNLKCTEPNELLSRIELKAREHEADIIFFDNFTTSVLSSRGISSEATCAKQLNAMARRLNIPIVVAAHTAKGSDKKEFITGDDVRGNATLVNLASYLYTIKIHFNNSDVKTFLFTDKARYHNKANKKMYELYFQREFEMFFRDMPVSYEYLYQYIKGNQRQK